MGEIVIPYKPRELQRDLHDETDRHRFSIIVAHRRFGKTVFAINKLLKDALLCTKEAPRFAYIAPTYKQAKAIAWDYMKKYAYPTPDVTFNEQELRCDLFNGARIRLFGADNPDSLRGIYLDGVVIDEVAQMPGKLWSEVLLPALADRKGWALFIGTPKGHNLFYDLLKSGEKDPEWFTAIYRASETGIIEKEELARVCALMSDAEYMQEFECSFEAAIAGAYYGKEMAQAEAEKRIKEVPWESGVPVITGWDLGFTDDTSIWFAQKVGSELRLIDFFTGSGHTAASIMKMLKEKPYVYGDVILPHDAANKTQGGGGSSFEDQLVALGMKRSDIVVLPNESIRHGIDSVRGVLNRCYFDRTKCGDGIEALKQYRRAWDDKNGVFKERPVHDWASHPADAMRTLVLGVSKTKPKDKIDFAQLYRNV